MGPSLGTLPSSPDGDSCTGSRDLRAEVPNRRPPPRPITTTRSPREEDVPTEQSQTLEETRVPPPFQHPGWAGDLAQPAAQGASSAERVILRLAHRDDFDLVRRLGEKRRSGPLGARVVPTPTPADDVRVGYAIGRRFGSAVKRNRMRRRLRHCVAQVVSEGPVPASHALFSAEPAALGVAHGELVGHCRAILVGEPGRAQTNLTEVSRP